MEDTVKSGNNVSLKLARESNSTLALPFNAVSALGFVIVAISTFLKFVPIVNQNWISMGIGLPVMFTALAGAFFVLYKNHFAAFFAAMFSAFFIVHGVIIAYDKKAIAADAVFNPGGYMRSIPLLFKDAMVPASGAFWGVTGASLALFALLVGWILKIYEQNKTLALLAEEEYKQNHSEDSESEEEVAIKVDEDTWHVFETVLTYLM